jgi:hypothetical protein
MTNQSKIIPAEAASSAAALREWSVTDAERDFVVVNDPAAAAIESARGKLADAMTPGFQAEFDPAEAEAAGAYQEDALSEADALASTHDAVPSSASHFPKE